MVYFCADDYGVSREGNRRIEACVKHGALNKVSVLPNGDLSGFPACFSGAKVALALHVNLVEGRPLSAPEEIPLLVTEDGRFRHSFVGLFFLSLSGKGQELERQLCHEIRTQIRFWKETVSDDNPIFLDSHQHTHMIPPVLKSLLRAAREEGVKIGYLRIPAEPILPYLCTPSLYFSFPPSGIVKQWLLKILALANRRELEKAQIPSAFFMGVLFSGRWKKESVEKLLAQHLKLAGRCGKDVEIGFHPGGSKEGEGLMEGSREDFRAFYSSPRRDTEFEILMNSEPE